MDNDQGLVQRDARGRVKKGSVLNKTGLDPRTARLVRDMQALAPRAIARLGRLIESENEQVALGAIKEALDRNMGRPKASVDVKVEASLSELHLEALRALTAKANEANIIDVTPAKRDENQGLIEDISYRDTTERA
jgi:hypothetical protein